MLSVGTLLLSFLLINYCHFYLLSTKLVGFDLILSVKIDNDWNILNVKPLSDKGNPMSEYFI